MDAAAALTELMALSSEIRRAAIVDETGAELTATVGTDGERLARVAGELFGSAPADAIQVEVDLVAGSVFAIREGGRVAVAITSPEPASALVLHDLRELLQRTGAETDDA